jgi:hypothetical protein
MTSSRDAETSTSANRGADIRGHPLFGQLSALTVPY